MLLHKPKRSWRLVEWLSFLENRHQQEVKLRLVNARMVAERLHLLDISVPVITVTGTNGKGSTVQSLETLYHTAGYRIGCYTSPHLLRFNERIRVNQKNIDDKTLCEIFWQIEAARGDVSLTYFETATLAALVYFKSQSLDVMVLEVGVGGRLDATNIVDADVAIITTVALDHQDYLGHDIESIAREKAGIMRAHADCIYADEYPPESIFQQAKSLQTNLWCYQQDYTVDVIEGGLMRWVCGMMNPVTLPCPAVHIKAAGAALMASRLLSKQLPISDLHRSIAMQSVNIPGRQQWVLGDVSIVYDVAHNPQAVSLLVDTLRQKSIQGRVRAVFSALSDKPVAELIALMSSIVDDWYPALLVSKRAASKDLLMRAFMETIERFPTCYETPVSAFYAAKQQAEKGDVIVVFGSFLVVSAVMEEMLHETNSV